MKLSVVAAVVRRQWPIVLTVMLAGLFGAMLALPHFHKYTGTVTLLSSNAPAGSAASLDPQKDPTSSAIGLYDLQSLATSQTIFHRVALKLGLSRSKEAELPIEVKAKVLPASNILPVSVTDPNRALSMSIANALADELSLYSGHLATGRYDELIANLKGQLAEQRKQLASIDAKIQAVSASDFFVTPENGTTAIDTRLIALQQQQQQLQALVRGDEAAASVTSLQPAMSEALARHQIVAADPSVTAQREQLGRDIAQLNLGLSAYTLNYPGLKSYILQVRKETAAVNRAETRVAQNPSESESYVNAEIAANRARSQLASDGAQLTSVRQQMSELSNHLSNSSSVGAQIAQLRRARAAGEDVYTDLSQRLARAGADRAQAGSIASVVVIDHAVKADLAVLGRPEVLIPLFLVVFAWLAISLAVLADGADDRLRTPEAIERLYGKPVFMPVG